MIIMIFYTVISRCYRVCIKAKWWHLTWTDCCCTRKVRFLLVQLN